MDEDFFDDDDDLDNLPANTLQELETRAFQATQHPPTVAQGPKPPSSDYGLDGEEADEGEIIDLDAPQQSNVITAWQPPTSAHPVSRPLARLSQHPDEVTQREQWRQQRYGVSAQNRLPAFKPPRTISAGNYVPQPDPFQRLASQTEISLQAKPNITTAEELVEPIPADANSAVDIAALRARIAELEQSQGILRQDNADAKAQAYAKAGEISILRANQDKTVKEYEHKLAVLQEEHARETIKHKAETEEAKKDREKIETNNRFLQHDLAEETDRARHARRALRGGQDNNAAKTQRSPASTPKKPASLPFRDGFNDEEVTRMSPSKSKDGSRTGTPTKPAGKRKRVEHEGTPGKQLSFSEQELQRPDDDTTPQTLPSVMLPERLREAQAQEGRSDLVQIVLDHRQPDSRRTVELLTNVALPSRPEVSLSSDIYDALHLSDRYREDVPIETHFCGRLLDLWLRCLDEQFFAPVTLLLSLLQEILLDSSDSLSANIVVRVVPLAIRTADVIATPKARAWANPTLHKGLSPEAEAAIPLSQCLDTLHMIALNCSDDADALLRFWRCMEQEFALIVLHKAQTLSDRITMLNILATSILEDTFGSVHVAATSNDEYATAQKQQQHENNLVSRIANILNDKGEQQRGAAMQDPSYGVPSLINVDMTEPQRQTQRRPDEEYISSHKHYCTIDLRLAALGLLIDLCSTEHGALLLAGHRFATGRIIRLLHESIVSMYNYNPDTHERTAACVNHSVMLLAHLCFTYGETLNLRSKLAAEPGGHHKHLVALSRVAFSSGDSVIEQGIWSESAEAAHKMLDDFLSPEEGDAVVSVFSSMRPSSPES